MIRGIRQRFVPLAETTEPVQTAPTPDRPTRQKRVVIAEVGHDVVRDPRREGRTFDPQIMEQIKRDTHMETEQNGAIHIWSLDPNSNVVFENWYFPKEGLSHEEALADIKQSHLAHLEMYFLQGEPINVPQVRERVRGQFPGDAEHVVGKS